MKVLVTGAGGFVGQSLVRRLQAHHQVVALDRNPPPDPMGAARWVTGDLADPEVAKALGIPDLDAIVHLATVPGGAAEQDPVAAWRVNIDATRMLFEAAARSERPVRIVYASSIAVFCDPLPADLNEDSAVAPRLLYGAHKAMMETWLATLTCRGHVCGVALRLPGIVARPGAPAGLKSAFLSDVFHALRTGSPIELPVSPQATTLLMSVNCATLNLKHALESDAVGTITLPALHVRVDEYVRAIAAATGGDEAGVRYTPDAIIEAQFGRWPALRTPRAQSLGFACEPNVAELVQSALDTLLMETHPDARTARLDA